MTRAGSTTSSSGSAGSAAPRCWELARRGHRVLGLERFELGHARGASHDTSRILRHSYHTPAYVRLTQEAYADWARLERESGTSLVTTTGGLDLFPPDPAIASDRLHAVDGRGRDRLRARSTPSEAMQRWPQLRVPPGTLGLYQADAAIVSAGRTTAVLHDRARSLGADLRDHSPVLGLEDLGEAGVRVTTSDAEVTCRGRRGHRRRVGQRRGGPPRAAGAARGDARAGHLLRGRTASTSSPVSRCGSGWTTRRSTASRPTASRPSRPPRTAAAQSSTPTTASDRTSDPDPAMEALLTEHLRAMLPGVGAPVRSVRCQYALTPDRDFVMAPVPGHESVVVGLGAAHGFKFVPTFGRVLADLVTTGDDHDRRVGVPAGPAGADRARLRPALAGVTCRSVSPASATSTPSSTASCAGHPAAQLLAGHAAVHHRSDGQAVDQRGERGHRRRRVRAGEDAGRDAVVDHAAQDVLPLVVEPFAGPCGCAGRAGPPPRRRSRSATRSRGRSGRRGAAPGAASPPGPRRTPPARAGAGRAPPRARTPRRPGRPWCRSGRRPAPG